MIEFKDKEIDDLYSDLAAELYDLQEQCEAIQQRMDDLKQDNELE